MNHHHALIRKIEEKYNNIKNQCDGMCALYNQTSLKSKRVNMIQRICMNPSTSGNIKCIKTECVFK